MAGARSYEYESDSFSEESSEDSSSEDSNHQKSSHKSSSESFLDLERIKQLFRVDLMYNENIGDWPKTTDLYYELDFKNQTKHYKDYESEKKRNRLSNGIKQGVKLHAEEILLNILNEEVMSKELSDVSISSDTSARSEQDKKMKMKLKILINYSPCKGCADKIKAFKEQSKNYLESDIRLTFGSFYEVYPTSKDNINIAGLAQLHKAGIKLRLVWDCKSLTKIIQQIGSEEDRKKREKIDRDYMAKVIEKAEKIED